MSDTSVQTSLRQAWFTSVVAIVSIAVLGLILEIAVGSEPAELFNKLTRARDGAEQVRMELTLLGKLLAAWSRITTLKETANTVGDKGLNNAIASVEKEMDRGDVFFITTELERLERENQRLSKLAEQLLTSAPKAMNPVEVNPGEAK